MRAKALSAIKWPTIKRDYYLRMIDRHLPLWAAMVEFAVINSIKSAVEIGCGIGTLCQSIDGYTGIDTNAAILRENQLFHRGRGTWINEDWRNLQPAGMRADLFVSSELIEHCESFEPMLEWVSTLPVKYAVVTFHKGLRRVAKTQRTDSLFFNNYYCRTDVDQWRSQNMTEANWQIYKLPLSRSREHRRRRWDSVLVIDRTREADLSMWEKRDVAG